MKKRNIFIALLLVLGCFALLPVAQAVITDPEGYFPNWNTAEGQSALLSLTTGLYNTALGGQALSSTTSGGFNTAVGFNALNHNTAGYNTATGVYALANNTTGGVNTANGVSALKNNSTGNYNVANGYQALQTNTTGIGNVANGYQALRSNTTGGLNTAIGYRALFRNTNFPNTATGAFALSYNTTGSSDTATGYGALGFNTTGVNNTANGTGALSRNTTGSGNTALGVSAGLDVTSADNVICIGKDVVGANTSNSCYIGNIFGKTSVSGVPVLINSNYKLGTVTSSKRFKEGIRPTEHASEALFALKPVTFRYKKELDPQGIPQFGLVAEDVEKVNPDLVVRDGEGKLSTVRYEAINAMLLNEFLNEHRKVEQQQGQITELNSRVAKQEVRIAQQRKDFAAAVAQQRKQIETLASSLQKVSTQLDMRKPAPRIVVNNH